MLKDRVAIITGAGRGIGRACAELFVQNHARVLINDLDAEAAAQSLQACQKIAGADWVTSFVGSVAETGFADKMFAHAAEHFGQVDILVNNAGITRDNFAHKMSDEQWSQVIDTNLNGTFYCCRASAPYMRDLAKKELKESAKISYNRKIINFFSISATKGNIGQLNYVAAKQGIIGITRALAREWAPFRVNVNAVGPGFTDTRLTQVKEDGDSFGIPKKLRQSYIDRIPFGQPASPMDVAKVVLFFASPMSDWVSGQDLNTSGGYQIP